MGNLEKRTQEVVFQTCLLLIKHFRNLIEFQNETNTKPSWVQLKSF